MLKIFNTLSRQKEEFKPIHAGKVGMYVCGVTIYDLCHIGHGRTFVAFDVVARYLRYLGYSLNYVRNVTDVDDKIIRRAAENHETCDQLTERMLAEMHADFDALLIDRPDQEPRATQHIAEIIEITQRLIDRDHAYVASNGDVMFSIDSDPQYGLLSRQDLDQLQAGARVEIDDVKRNPMDFVLWKMSKPGEPSWQSPWGPGRPGWHEQQMWGTVIVGLVNVLATFIAIGLVDRWGRKPTLILGFIVMAVGMGALGTMMNIGMNSAAEQYFAIVMLLMFIVGFAMSAGPLIWVLCSEIQPLKGRDFGITCSTATNWIANMIVGATFLTMLNSLGSAHTFWVYAGLNVLFVFITLALIPETKNISLEHIERNLMAGKPLRNIGSR